MSTAEIVLLFLLSCLLWLIFKNIFASFGLLIFLDVIAHKVYQVAKIAYTLILGTLTLKKRLNSYGQWAVVTGCTRGLGREFSLQLAEAGLDMVLIGRNGDLLNNLELEIREKYRVKTVKIQVDFSGGDKLTYKMINEKLKELDGDIGILDTALFSQSGGESNGILWFYVLICLSMRIETQDILDSVYVNVIPSALLSHMVIKEYMLHKKRGLVVFIGSASSTKPTPFFNAYAASKSYIEHLARSLHEEYKDSGVYVQGITPYFVVTDMTAYASFKPSLFTPTAHTYVKSAIACFGMTSITAAYFPHVFLILVLESIPYWLYAYCCRCVVNRLINRFILKKNKKNQAMPLLGY